MMILLLDDSPRQTALANVYGHHLRIINRRKNRQPYPLPAKKAICMV